MLYILNQNHIAYYINIHRKGNEYKENIYTENAMQQIQFYNTKYGLHIVYIMYCKIYATYKKYKF